MELFIGKIDLTVSDLALEEFVKRNYDRFYKSEKVRHAIRNDARLPNVKITGDLVSARLFFLDKNGGEHSFFLEGRLIDKKMICISDINPDLFEFYEFDDTNLLDILLSLSKGSERGKIFVSHDNEPIIIESGKKFIAVDLLNRIYEQVELLKRETINDEFLWLRECLE